MAASETADKEPAAYPVEMPGQNVFIYNAAHSAQCVRSARPMIRVLGVVADNTQAIAALRGVPIDAPVFTCTARRFTLLTRRPEEEDAAERIETMSVKRYDEYLATKKALEEREEAVKARFAKESGEFDAMDREMKGGGAAETPPEEEAETPEEEPQLPIQPAETPDPPANAAEDADGDGEGEYVARWTADIRNQQFAAVSIMEDEDTERDEPAVCVYGAFATEADCTRYITRTLAPLVREHNIMCVQMYEWVEVTREAIAQIANVSYRDEELAKIMQSFQTSAHDIEQYKLRCADEEVEPNIIDCLGGEGEGEGEMKL